MRSTSTGFHLAISLATAFFLAGVSVSFASLSASAAPKRSRSSRQETSYAKKAAGARDPNVKSNTTENAPGSDKKIVRKGAGQTRGSGPYSCIVHVDNTTGLYINVYVDGDLRGFVGPLGDLYVPTGNGPTTFYGRANFTGSSTYDYWGPWSFNCEGSFTWRLH